MLALSIAVTALAIALIWQQIFLMRQLQLLVNKVMSGDYHSYMRTEAPAQRERVNLPQDPPEDLRPLQEFQL